MLARNICVPLKSNALSDGPRNVDKNTLPYLSNQNGMRKLMVSGMMLGLLTGAGVAQRAGQQSAPSARPGPTANTQAPTTNTQLPTANTQSPAANTQSPTANTQAPTANTQAPTANTVNPTANTVSPDATALIPDASPVDPNMNTVAPTTTPVAPSATPIAPRDMTQKPPIPPNATVSPDAAPPTPQP
jgi:hypothetical protein